MPETFLVSWINCATRHEVKITGTIAEVAAIADCISKEFRSIVWIADAEKPELNMTRRNF